jgi:catechol 2,3-dioxygenase-like lactoylglutathione lyase family enzyme
MQVDCLDHLVLTGADIEVSCRLYNLVLGKQVITFGEERKALQFGQQKITLHELGKEFEPKAAYPTLGSADLCFITSLPLNKVMEHLRDCDVTLLEGPVKRTAAMGVIQSAYFHDPDDNLIEVSHY